MSDATPPPNDERVHAPPWTRMVPWPSRMPALAPGQWKLLGLLGAAEFVDHYDIGLLSILIVQIQQDLGVAENEIGQLAGWLRFGALFSLAAGVLADRVGRRRLLLITVLGFTITTFMTAFARTPVEFALFQFVGRGFLYAETALAIVMVTEELAAKDRGFGLGLLGALGAFGHGATAIALSLVEHIPYGWRTLYAVGALPLLGLAWLRRGLPETARFAASRTSKGRWWAPLHSLATAYPKRLAALLGVAFSLDLAASAAGMFMAKTLQEVHGYSPGQVTVLYLTGGVLAIAGNQAAGLWSDRVGRKPVLIVLMLLMGAAYTAFYDTSGFWIAPLWIVQVFALQGVTVLVRALGSELFPTSYRGTASSARMVVSTLGGVSGLFIEAWLYDVLGSHSAAITALLPALLVAAALAGFAIPETAGRELEEVSPERSTS